MGTTFESLQFAAELYQKAYQNLLTKLDKLSYEQKGWCDPSFAYNILKDFDDLDNAITTCDVNDCPDCDYLCDCDMSDLYFPAEYCGMTGKLDSVLDYGLFTTGLEPYREYFEASVYFHDFVESNSSMISSSSLAKFDQLFHNVDSDIGKSLYTFAKDFISDAKPAESCPKQDTTKEYVTKMLSTYAKYMCGPKSTGVLYAPAADISWIKAATADNSKVSCKSCSHTKVNTLHNQPENTLHSTDNPIPSHDSLAKATNVDVKLEDLVKAAETISKQAQDLSKAWNNTIMDNPPIFDSLWSIYGAYWIQSFVTCSEVDPKDICSCLNAFCPIYFKEVLPDVINIYAALKPFFDFMTGDLKTFIELVNGNITLLSPKAETWFAQTFNTKQSWGHSYSDLPTTLVSPLCPGCPQVADLLNFYPIAQKFYPFNSQIDLYQALQNAPAKLNES